MTSTVTLDSPTAELVTSSIQEIALDWLQSKEIEDAGKVAKKVRDTAAQTLKGTIGHGGTVTVNKGGFKTYELSVSERSRVSESKVLAEIEILYPNLSGAIASLKEKHRAPFEVIGLKPIKR